MKELMQIQLETKQNVNYVEYVIRTLKGLVYNYFLHRQTYTDVLQDLISNYNHLPHGTLKGLTPQQVNKKQWSPSMEEDVCRYKHTEA